MEQLYPTVTCTPIDPFLLYLTIFQFSFPTLRSMKIDSSHFGRYELLYGVTMAESYNMLNAAEVKFGMTSERKNKLLRAYVSNNFDHQVSMCVHCTLYSVTNYFCLLDTVYQWCLRPIVCDQLPRSSVLFTSRQSMENEGVLDEVRNK